MPFITKKRSVSRRIFTTLFILFLLLAGALAYVRWGHQVKQTAQDQARLHSEFKGHRAHVWEVKFSPNGTMLASASIDSTVLAWDKQGRILHTLKHPIGVTTIEFSPDGTLLASGGYDEVIRLWRVADGQLARTLPGHKGTVWAATFSPDGRTLASAGEDKLVKLWNVNTGALIRSIPGHRLNVWAVKFSPDGRTLASGSFDNDIRIWDAATGRLLRTLTGHTEAVLNVDFSTNGRLLASASDDKTIRLWEVSTGQLVRTFRGDGECVYSLDFSPDNQQLAGAYRDQTALGEIYQNFLGTNATAKSVTVRIWDVTTGELRQTFAQHGDDAYNVAYSPDGRWLASASSDQTVDLWQLRP
ncbi:MAG: repeat protein [Hymenobacter sp.]|nr:repeat protein [Hymenobacter sp.]